MAMANTKGIILKLKSSLLHIMEDRQHHLFILNTSFKILEVRVFLEFVFDTMQMSHSSHVNLSDLIFKLIGDFPHNVNFINNILIKLRLKTLISSLSSFLQSRCFHFCNSCQESYVILQFLFITTSALYLTPI